MSMNEMELAEKPALQAFQDIGYEYKPGRELGPSSDDPERESLSEVVLRDRLKSKLREFNPSLPNDAIEAAVSKLIGFNSPQLLKTNQNFHQNLIQGVHVEFENDGETIGRYVDVINFDEPEKNDFWYQIR